MPVDKNCECFSSFVAFTAFCSLFFSFSKLQQLSCNKTMPVCNSCDASLPRTAFAKAQLKKRAGSSLRCLTCASEPAADEQKHTGRRADGRQANGQYTTAMHQRARDAEALGRQLLAQQRTHSPEVTDSEDGVAHSLETLNALLAAEDTPPLDELDYQAYLKWLPSDWPMDEESVCDWVNSDACCDYAAGRIASVCTCESEGKRHCTCTWRGLDAIDLRQIMIPGITCDGDYDGLDALADRFNYHLRPNTWKPGGGDHVPEGWGRDFDYDANLDPEYVLAPDLTTFCMSCKQIRAGQRGLSHIELSGDHDLPTRVADRFCKSCDGEEYDAADELE